MEKNNRYFYEILLNLKVFHLHLDLKYLGKKFVKSNLLRNKLNSLLEGVFLTRDLVSEPGNILHPDETLQPPEYYIPDILESFKRRQIKPKFHISEQGSGKVGHHSDYVEVIPDYLLEIPEKYNTHIDIMIEAKMKEKSIKHLYEKYPFLDCKITVK